MSYLDYQATTPVAPEVLEAMLPWFTTQFGNAGSRTHRWGMEASAAVELAREEAAGALGCEAGELVFTSGATEANNLALLGALEAHRDSRDHLITQATEHASVMETAQEWQRLGGRVTILPVDGTGRVDPDDVRAALTPRTLVVSIMAANNEIGTLQDLATIGRFTHEAGAFLHTDAAQAAGKIPLAVNDLGIDLMGISGHKFFAPKGIGLMYIRRKGPRVTLHPRTFGGGHERGLRSGTLPVPMIVGIAKALQRATSRLPEDGPHLQALRNRLLDGLRRHMPDLRLNGHPTERLPGNLSVSFPGVKAADLMGLLPQYAVSAGSACASGKPKPSHVLEAIGLPADLLACTIRFSPCAETPERVIDEAANAFGEGARTLLQRIPS